MLYAILIATSTLALLVLSTAIIVLTKHCVRRRRETKAMNKLQNQDHLEAERGKVQEEYKVINTSTCFYSVFFGYPINFKNTLQFQTLNRL